MCTANVPFAFLHYGYMHKECHTLLKPTRSINDADGLYKQGYLQPSLIQGWVFIGVFKFPHPCELLNAATKICYGL